MADIEKGVNVKLTATDEAQAASYGRQVLEAMAFLTAAGLPCLHVHAGNVLVDGGENEGGWGSEIPMRAGLEKMYMRLYSVPCVLLVLGGGMDDVSFAIARASITRNWP